MQLSEMKIYDIDITLLREYENNPRHNDNAVEPVANSIKQCGFRVPILVEPKADGTFEIVAGHTRKKAAELLKRQTVPCMLIEDMTAEQIKLFRVIDNKTAELAGWDFIALEKELADLENSFDLTDFGFDVDEINADDFGEEFSLPDGDKCEICQMTFTLHTEQAELIKHSMSVVGECFETFGNTNKNGNALYEVVRQWAEQKK